MSRTWRERATRALALACAGAIFGGGAFAAFELAAHLRAKRTPTTSVTAVEAEAPLDKPSQATRLAMRDLVQRAIAAAPEFQAPSQLESYLAELESRARARGAVTALEIEPGLAAANDLAGPERARDFVERMRTLQKELPPAQPAPSLANPRPELEPTAASMSAALATIAGTTGAEQGAQVRQYLRAADQLPEDEHLARQAELNALLSRGHAAVPTPDMDALLARIQAAPAGSERHALIRDYVEAADQLPEPDQTRRFEALPRPLKAASGTRAPAGAL